MPKYFPTPNFKIEIHVSKINLIGDITRETKTKFSMAELHTTARKT